MKFWRLCCKYGKSKKQFLQSNQWGSSGGRSGSKKTTHKTAKKSDRKMRRGSTGFEFSKKDSILYSSFLGCDRYWYSINWIYNLIMVNVCLFFLFLLSNILMIYNRACFNVGKCRQNFLRTGRNDNEMYSFSFYIKQQYAESRER